MKNDKVTKYKSLIVFIVLFPIFAYNFFINAQQIINQYNRFASIKHIIITDTFFSMILSLIFLLIISVLQLLTFNFIKKTKWADVTVLVLIGLIFSALIYILTLVFYEFYVNELLKEMYYIVFVNNSFLSMMHKITFTFGLVIIVLFVVAIVSFNKILNYIKQQNFFTNPGIITFSYDTQNYDIKNNIIHLVNITKIKTENNEKTLIEKTGDIDSKLDNGEITKEEYNRKLKTFLDEYISITSDYRNELKQVLKKIDNLDSLTTLIEKLRFSMTKKSIQQELDSYEESIIILKSELNE